MNILFYCSEYPPYTTGGIGRVTKIVAETLAARGHKVHIIGFYSSMPTVYECSEENGVSVFRHKLDSMIEKKPLLFRCIRKLGLSRRIAQKQVDYVENIINDHILKYNIDVFELTDFYPFVLLAPRLRFRDFPAHTVLRIHGSASFVQALSGKGKKYYVKNDSAHFSRCQSLLAVSQFSLKYVLDHYSLPENIHKGVVYNPIDDNYLKMSEDKDDSILFIGKLIETKGCFSLARAFNIIADKYPNTKLVFVGGGEQADLKMMINKQYLNRVIFLGYCDRDKLTEVIDSCSFACIPSYFENFSMVVLEVMARGKTLIFTERTSGKEIIIDGVNGYTVNPEDEFEIASKLELLICNRELRMTLAKNAYKIIDENYRATVIVDQLESSYSHLLDRCN